MVKVAWVGGSVQWGQVEVHGRGKRQGSQGVVHGQGERQGKQGRVCGSGALLFSTATDSKWSNVHPLVLLLCVTSDLSGNMYYNTDYIVRYVHQ